MVSRNMAAGMLHVLEGTFHMRKCGVQIGTCRWALLKEPNLPVTLILNRELLLVLITF
jgi:hypothetical protein